MKEIKQDLKKSGIYCIINIESGKRYIGSSLNVYQRLLCHRSLLRNQKHENRKLQSAWNKHKEELFDYYILEFCDKENLINREQFYIDTLNPEYNLILKVERVEMSQESKKLMSESRKRGIINGTVTFKTKKLYKYDLDGNFICEYSDFKSATEDCKLSTSQITRVLTGQYKRSRNFMWRREFSEKIEPFKKSYHDMSILGKKVELMNIETNEIDYKFKSIAECARFFNVFTPVIFESIRKNRIFKKKYKIIKL